MIPIDDFDHDVSAWFHADAERRVPPHLDAVLRRTRSERQRTAWSSLERWLPIMESTNRSRTAAPRTLVILAIVALLIAVLGAVAISGSFRPANDRPAIVAPVASASLPPVATASLPPAIKSLPPGVLLSLWARNVCQISDYWQRPGGIMAIRDDIGRSIQRGDLTNADSLGYSFLVKVDQAMYVLGQTPDWEPGAVVKGLFRDGFRTIRTAGEAFRRAETLDEASALVPQFTEGTATLDQAVALFPDLQRAYPDFTCP